MNKNLIYVGGAVLGIGAAVAVFSVMGSGDDDGPTVNPVSRTEHAPPVQGGLKDPVTGEATPSMPKPEVTKPKAGLEDRQALLQRPAADLALRSEVTLKVLAMEVRNAGDEALADEIMAHVVASRKERYNEDLDGEALIGKVDSFAKRGGATPGLSARGQEAHAALVSLLAEYR